MKLRQPDLLFLCQLFGARACVDSVWRLARGLWALVGFPCVVLGLCPGGLPLSCVGVVLCENQTKTKNTPRSAWKSSCAVSKVRHWHLNHV